MSSNTSFLAYLADFWCWLQFCTRLVYIQEGMNIFWHILCANWPTKSVCMIEWYLCISSALPSLTTWLSSRVSMQYTHSQRDILLPILSVCLSNTGSLSKRTNTSSHLRRLVVAHARCLSSIAVQNSKANHISRSANCTGGGDFANIALHLENGTS